MEALTRTAVDEDAPARDSAARKLSELATAVREHEESVRRARPLGIRAQDDRLYRRLRQICGGR